MEGYDINITTGSSLESLFQLVIGGLPIVKSLEVINDFLYDIRFNLLRLELFSFDVDRIDNLSGMLACHKLRKFRISSFATILLLKGFFS
jgi:hypothetical protein